MHNDDEVYAVDDVFLGPTKRTFPFRVRYRAYGIGSLLYVLALSIEVKVHVIGFWAALYALLAVIYTTMKIMDHVDHENTARAVVIAFWHEVKAPRDRRSGATTARLSLRAVRRRTR
ncbi:hypothetical protein [Actinacidiphila reveromycinica]|nr:hypothetical protein [Streptomyces sp. SN-593]